MGKIAFPSDAWGRKGSIWYEYSVDPSANIMTSKQDGLVVRCYQFSLTSHVGLSV